MEGDRRRVQALQALIAGSIINGQPEFLAIQSEFQAVYDRRGVRNLNGRRLLQVLHAFRALDSSLQALLVADGQSRSTSIGGTLNQLTSHGVNRTGLKLTGPLRAQHQKNVADVRNAYLHSAGLFPASGGEVSDILHRLESCLQDVINLT